VRQDNSALGHWTKSRELSLKLRYHRTQRKDDFLIEMSSFEKAPMARTWSFGHYRTQRSIPLFAPEPGLSRGRPRLSSESTFGGNVHSHENPPNPIGSPSHVRANFQSRFKGYRNMQKLQRLRSLRPPKIAKFDDFGSALVHCPKVAGFIQCDHVSAPVPLTRFQISKKDCSHPSIGIMTCAIANDSWYR